MVVFDCAVIDGSAPGDGLAGAWALVEDDGEHGWPFACNTWPGAQDDGARDGDGDGVAGEITDGAAGDADGAVSDGLCANAGALASSMTQAPANSRCFMACLRERSTAKVRLLRQRTAELLAERPRLRIGSAPIFPLASLCGSRKA